MYFIWLYDQSFASFSGFLFLCMPENFKPDFMLWDNNYPDSRRFLTSAHFSLNQPDHIFLLGKHAQFLQSCLTLCGPVQPARPLGPQDSPGKNTGVCCHAFLQRIFLTQGLNPCLLPCRWILYPLSYLGNPHIFLFYVAAVAKSLQSCPTLCDPQTAAHQAPIPGILQARTLEWVAVSFSSA